MKQTYIQQDNVTKTGVTLYLYITINFFPFFCCKTGCCRCRFVFPQSSTSWSQSFKVLFTKFRKFWIISFLTRPLKYFRLLVLPLYVEIILNNGLQAGFRGAQGFCRDLKGCPYTGGRMGCCLPLTFRSQHNLHYYLLIYTVMQRKKKRSSKDTNFYQQTLKVELVIFSLLFNTRSFRT